MNSMIGIIIAYPELTLAMLGLLVVGAFILLLPRSDDRLPSRTTPSHNGWHQHNEGEW